MPTTSFEKLMSEVPAASDTEVKSLATEGLLVQMSDKKFKKFPVADSISHVVKTKQISNIQNYSLSSLGVMMDKLFLDADNASLGAVVAPYTLNIEDDTSTYGGQRINLGVSGEWGVRLIVGKTIKNNSKISISVRFRYESAPSAGQLNLTIKRNGNAIHTYTLGNNYTSYTTDTVAEYVLSGANDGDIIFFSLKGAGGLNKDVWVEAFQVDILSGEESVSVVRATKADIDTLYQAIIAQKTASDEALAEAQDKIDTVSGQLANLADKVAAVTLLEGTTDTYSKAAVDALGQSNDVLRTVRTVAASSAFPRLAKIKPTDFDGVTKKVLASRDHINRITFVDATGVTTPKLIIPPNIVQPTDSGVGVLELRNIGDTSISIEPQTAVSGAVMPRYLNRWVAGHSILTTDITQDAETTITCVLDNIPAVAKGGMILFFVCAQTKFFVGTTTSIVTARWSAGTTGTLTPRIVTGMPTQKSGSAQLYSFEYKLADDFAGGTYTAEFVVHSNCIAWDIQAILLDQVDQVDGTPVWNGSNSLPPSQSAWPVTYTTVGANCMVFNFAGRVYVTGSAPTFQTANPIATIWSNQFPNNINDVYNSHVDILGYDLVPNAGTSKTYNPTMGKTIQNQNSAIAYRGLSGTNVAGAVFLPNGNITLDANKSVVLMCDPTFPDTYYV